jgi:hypothetical protein
MNYSYQDTVALDREPLAVNDYNTDWQTGFKLPQGVTNVGRIDAVDIQTGRRYGRMSSARHFSRL